MKQRAKMQSRPRPKLPRIAEEMLQWSDSLLREVLDWPNVTSRPMFGMTAVYRGNDIFGVLPRTRAMDTPYSVSFKLFPRNSGLDKALKADPRIIVPDAKQAKWISFELESGDDLPDAVSWFVRAYQLARRPSRPPHRSKDT